MTCKQVLDTTTFLTNSSKWSFNSEAGVAYRSGVRDMAEYIIDFIKEDVKKEKNESERNVDND